MFIRSATQLIESDAIPKDVAGRLGHAKVQITGGYACYF